MREYIPTITFEQAKAIAEKAAFEQLAPFVEDESDTVLSDKHAEAEYCWFFFRKQEIVGPPEKILTWGAAYAISKKGELRLIADFMNEPDKLREYIQVMSKYFEAKGL
ncbi:hypothetical protein [Cohnella fermenti]|uniref:Uncharacterized protein n=1 Tax=Cohnella fermenti TaxID=2565925 RepID=A0A4S4BHC6_9BACL|nr:hypothetical protein [Cohnella fermenti]THF73948.1 hypothetical protein E6C55_27145 [Cohnella fermenti]